MRKFILATLMLTTCPLAPAFADSMTSISETSAALPVAIRHPAEKPELHYLNADDYLPQRIIAQPPMEGSETQKQELAFIRAQIAAATPERLAQAKHDGETENPTLYNEVLRRDLTKLPATWDLLVTVQDEADAAADIAKAAYMRPRPYTVDQTMPTCTKVDPTKPAKSYPSGHASVGYSVGWALAKLMPEMAPAILSRAEDYARGRELCGVHFPSDVEASHVFATLIADRLLSDARLADKVAAAKAELAASNLRAEIIK
jgi:acid phosphatase (class A)